MLGEREAHIWLAPTDLVSDPAVYQRCLEILDPEERVAQARFLHERDRGIYLVGHVLVRTVLSHYGTRAPREWRFVRNQHGRPEIVDGGKLRFNLSHTRGMAACLVIHEVDAGVDVEQRRERETILRVAERFFSPAEVSDLFALPEAVRVRRFFELWTLKEAYIKGRGMGLALPLSGFSYSFGSGISLYVAPELNDVGSEWQCGMQNLSVEHQLAWAIRARGSPFTVTVRTMSAEQLGQ